MKFSISTHALSGHSLSEALEILAPHTEYVEIMSDGKHYLTSAESLACFNYHWTLHAPTHGVNIASVLEPIRTSSVQVITDTFRIAGEISADVVVHPGNYAWEREREKSIASLKRSFAKLHTAAEEYSIRFFVENMGNWGFYYLQKPEDLSLFKGIPLCLDVGHANECKTLDAFLQVPIDHFHLHDNVGDKDTHLAAGDGNIDFPHVMQKVAECNVDHPVIEAGTFDDCLKSIDYLKQYL